MRSHIISIQGKKNRPGKSNAGVEKYLVSLIAREDGQAIDKIAHAYLTNANFHYDTQLRGFVTSNKGLPWAFSVFLPAHNLTVTETTTSYDPDWFAPPSPDLVFEIIQESWDGYEVKSTSNEVFPMVWFLAKNQNAGRPFLAYWCESKWSQCLTNGEQLSPSEVISNDWTILATARECIQMSEKRIDDARKAKFGKSEIEALANDIEGAALQVGIATGRINRLKKV